MNNIYFTGIPGSGKTTLAKALAEDFDRVYIDLDKYIEEKNHMTIPDIFAKHGENFFRKSETECLAEISHKNGVFIATGGGIVKCGKNIEIMKKSGSIIYINTPPENILKNSTLSGRPLLKDKNAIFKLYDERKSLYESSADFTLDNFGTICEAKKNLAQILEICLNVTKEDLQ